MNQREKEKMEDRYRDAAKRLRHEEGQLEVDDDAQVSLTALGEGGAYVQAWVWVPKSELGRAKR